MNKGECPKCLRTVNSSFNDHTLIILVNLNYVGPNAAVGGITPLLCFQQTMGSHSEWMCGVGRTLTSWHHVRVARREDDHCSKNNKKGKPVLW